MKKINSFFTKMISLLICLGFSGWVVADEEGPIEIRTVEELKAIPQEGEYKLMNDIELTEDWEPISYETSGGYFRGTFDGNGHVIKGMRVSKSGENNVGLFGGISNATVKNLGIENAYLVGDERVGGIAGYSDRSLIEQCYVANSYIEGRDKVGGIAGFIEWVTIIKDSYVIAEVHGREHQAGGIAGATGSTNGTMTLSNCYFAGTVYSRYNRAGGIIGLIDSGDEVVKIENCVNLAESIEAVDPFRIVDARGRNTIMENNYSLSSTLCNSAVIDTNNEYYGANNYQGANILSGSEKDFSFYTQTLSWSADVWKALTDGYPILKWQNPPVDLKLVGMKDIYLLQDGGQIDLSEITSFRDLELTFTTSSNSVVINGAIVTPNGEIAAGENVEVTISIDSDDYVITNNVITIKLMPAGIIKLSSPEDLALITSNPGMDFELISNIDMTGRTFSGLCSATDPFTGTFDGNGYVITGLSFDDEAISNIALFSAARNATIKNVGIENANFKGNENIAGIVGRIEGGRIEQCYVMNSVINGRDRAAGIAAWVLYNDTEIENCYVQAEIIGREHQLGGIVAANYNIDNPEEPISKLTIKNCYFEGALQGQYGYGASMLGLMDRDMYVEIENCVSIASSIVSGTAKRIVNWGIRESFVKLENNYSISTTEGADWDESNLANGITLSNDIDTKSEEFYINTLNWDLDEIWAINDGEEYPTLKIFNKEETWIIEGNVMTLLENYNVVDLPYLHIPAEITAVDMTTLTLAASVALPTPVNPNCLIYVNEESDDAIKNTTNVIVTGDEPTAVKIELTDDNAFANIMAFTTSDITFTRTDLKENTFSSIYLPFSVTIPEGMSAYAFDKVENSVVIFEKVDDSIVANIPYLFKNASASLTLSVQTEVTIEVTEEKGSPVANTFIGTFSNINPTGNYYGYSDGEFVKGSGTKVPAFRAYLQGEDEGTVLDKLPVELRGGEVNMENIQNAEMIILSAQGAIEILSTQEETINVYSVEGRLVRSVVLNEGYNRIEGLASGLYLVNNHKVMVK